MDENQDGAAGTAPLLQAIPDLGLLLGVAFADAVFRDSPWHGEGHWRAVAKAGLELARYDSRVDLTVVFLFAVLHDTCRENENYDPGHGPRAALKASELAGTAFYLSGEQQDVLETALGVHTESERYESQPTIAACLDADRLDFWRLGECPQERFMSTPAARGELFDLGKRLHVDQPSWQELFDAYASLQMERELALGTAEPNLSPQEARDRSEPLDVGGIDW